MYRTWLYVTAPERAAVTLGLTRIAEGCPGTSVSILRPRLAEAIDDALLPQLSPLGWEHLHEPRATKRPAIPNVRQLLAIWRSHGASRRCCARHRRPLLPTMRH